MGEKVHSKKFAIIKNLALVTQLGLSMALPIVAGVYLGSWLDGYFDTQPILLIVCLIIFSIGSFINLFKLAGIKKKKTVDITEDKNNKSGEEEQNSNV